MPTTTRYVTFKNKRVNVGAFPIGIEPEKFTRAMQDPKVLERLAQLEHEFEGRHVMVGVDRLDYVKALPQKLRAFEMFLVDHPEYVGRVVMIQIAIPTRGEVEEYQNLRLLVNELVGRINGKFGRFITLLAVLRFEAMLTSHFRYDRIHAHSLHAPVRRLSRTCCALCCL